MSTAGRADAAGGLFRIHVAIYLAVHGLRGRSVPGLDLPADVVPVRLAFETADPTDDIKVTFSDGRHAYVSAKRSVGNNSHLESTVAGWVAQVPTADERDLLVLAAEELTGVVRELEGALKRRRGEVDQAERPKDTAAIAAVIKHVPDGLREQVLGSARLLHVPHVTNSDLGTSYLAEVASNIVEGDQGNSVVSALGHEFTRQAGDGDGSTIEDWEAALAAGGLRVAPDPGGVPGRQAAARRLAVEAYGARLTRHRGMIDLTLLADDLPPVHVDDLLDQIRVGVRGDRDSVNGTLLSRVRRWRRLLLVGPPGAGKSIAVRELAAACVENPDAPVPIVIPLLKALGHFPRGLDVDDLLEVCVHEFVGEEHRPALRTYLREQVDRGDAILICDGLDECGARAPWVAQQLRSVAASVHARTGLVISTRPSAELAAGRLDLPRVELREPSGLRDTTDAILEACADLRAAQGERDAWMRSRRKWIARSREEHRDLMEVPLLANLVTLICADTPEHALPTRRARVLHQAVTRSVERWESERESADEARPWAPEVTQAMLLDGFIELGRLLDTPTAPTRQAALDALGRLLSGPRWSFPVAPATELATHVLRFWDERVAVFVVDGDGLLGSRSRVFVDIALAMWTAGAPRELRDWLAEVIQYTDTDDAIGLSADLHPPVLDALLDLGSTGSPAATAMVLALTSDAAIDLTDAQRLRMLTNLERHVADQVVPPRRSSRDQTSILGFLRGRTSRFETTTGLLIRVCQLPWDGEARARRDELVRVAGLAEDETVILTAIAGLADATRDVQPVSEQVLRAVERVMEIPVPQAPATDRTSRRHVFVVPPARQVGIAEVAMAVAPHLRQLEDRRPGSARWVFDAAKEAPRGGEEAQRSLAVVQQHVEAVDARAAEWQHERWARLAGSWPNGLDLDHRHDVTLVAHLAALGDPVRANGPLDAWSLTDAGDLLEAVGYATVTYADFRDAFRAEFDALRGQWLAVLARARGLDADAIGAQARHVLATNRVTTEISLSSSSDWQVLTTPAIEHARKQESSTRELSAPDQEVLAECLVSGSNWMAASAANLLANARPVRWNPTELFARDLPHLSMRSAAIAYAVAVLADHRLGGELLTAAASNAESSRRWGAQIATSVDDDLDPDGVIRAKLRVDEDLTVRLDEDHAAEPAASYWSCAWCRTPNPIAEEACSECAQGDRPRTR
ncbi:NACHT domain-containing protein [Cellulomonas sp. NPDC058312]|uniref:NACHT domain-containing protein n=1 Tax=Cellulomonas sp. NPDC058312 TaxID=3346441 RepID=UPI0036ED0DE6